MSEKPTTGRRLRLETPEHVRLDYELADVGSRLAALLIDMAIIVGGLTLLMIADALLRRGGMSLGESLAASVLVLGFFVLQWGYFLAFELLRTLNRVVELDPRRAEAYHYLVGYYLNAPPIAGGSVQKAEEYARTLASFDPEGGEELLKTVAARR